jgi:hypothetical protein
MRKMRKMSKFPVPVPVELHRAFKVKCASKGVLMSEVVRGWLERECATVGKEKPSTSAKRFAEANAS